LVLFVVQWVRFGVGYNVQDFIEHVIGIQMISHQSLPKIAPPACCEIDAFLTNFVPIRGFKAIPK
jgi:hypothetical protein